MGQNAISQPLLRREDARLLTGNGKFLADMVPAGAAHMIVVRSPHAHARIVSMDTAAARAAPGVLAVLAGGDLAADGIGAIPAGADLIRLPGTPDGIGYEFRPEHPALAIGRVRYVGQPVAVVIAGTEALARDAAERVRIDYEPLSAVTGVQRAVEPGSPGVWEEAPGNVCFRWSAGDAASVAAAFAGAAQHVSVRVVNNRVYVGALEDRAAIGTFEDGRYILRTGSQMPHGLRDALADDVFHVSPRDVRVLIGDVGGSFGIKNALYPEQVLVLWAAKRLGRAVAWIGERGEGMLSDYQARDNVSTGMLALDAEGRFLAMRVETLADLGAFLAPKGQLSPTTNTPALAGVYRLPHIHVSVTGVFTNTAPTEVYRGAGRPEAIYLLERLIEAAAAARGENSVALRTRNLIVPEDLPYQTALGLLYDSGDFPAMLRVGLEDAGFAGFEGRRREALSRNMLRGIGLTHYCERVAGGWSEEALLELGADGRMTVLIGTQSNGQGHETSYAQIVADLLGVPVDDVSVVQGDTDRIPSGHGTGGSASIGIGGAALSAASSDLVAKALPLAADVLEAAEADVAFDGEGFRIAGTDRTASWRDVARVLGTRGTTVTLQGHGAFTPSTPTFPNGCHVAEVEVDPETGAVTIAAYTMLHDFGRVINPMLLEGQLQGGVVQGIGQAAIEHYVHDAASGQVLTGSLMDYALPRAADCPPLVLRTMATPSPFNPLGVKGCGEAGAAGAPPAVMNAILNALRPLGVTTLDMPATPLRVWEAIRRAASS